MSPAVRLGCALVALTFALTSAHADTLSRPVPRIVNGVFSSDYPSTGALLRGSDADTASTWCSGTLIGCSTFLTAGHCVDGRSPSEFQVFLPNAGIFPVISIVQHPSFDFPAGDVAVLKLGTAVTGVAPSMIETGATPPAGTPGVIVGYGRSGDPLYDYGLKRAGSVVTALCSTIPPPGSDSTSVCWNFSSPQGPPGGNSNTCNADSGGPLFVDSGSGPRIAGVTSGGSSAACLPTDHSYDANVFTYRTFIQTEGGSDLANTRCGSGPQVGETGTTVLASTGTVDGANPQSTYSFQVPAGATMLRVAMNAVDDGPSDFDLYVRAGTAPTTSVYDCGRFGSNQFGICEFPAPATGIWYVLVNRYAGAGTYQLTVTEFATACAAPGSDGNACDDDNACTAADVCQAGVCAGTPVGNGTPCNDGNACTAPDTCQAGVCDSSTVANGTSCDDGDPCSRPDTCQAGSCNGTAPALGCKVTTPGAALLAIDDRSPDTRDRLAWTWRKGAATSLAELGTPTTTTPYTLCLYDAVGSVPQRRLTQVIPPGPRWKPYSRGFRYRDASLSAGGLQSIVLTDGAAGRAGVQVRGKGQPLALPGLPLTNQPNVIIQLLNDTTCWSSTYSTTLENDLARFKAKSD
jgi:hypothetical protein